MPTRHYQQTQIKRAKKAATEMKSIAKSIGHHIIEYYSVYASLIMLCVTHDKQALVRTL